MFVTDTKPFLGSVFLFQTLNITVPSAAKTIYWLATLWRGNIRFSMAMLFDIDFVSLFVSGGLMGIVLVNATLEIQLHNTYFLVAHFHLVIGSAALFGMFAGVDHWFPQVFGRMMNEKVGKPHFWLTFLGV